ncbi:achaete-scute homolog 4-like [Mya arenaria]|uniref:achaete-scute homolog 4-like n=1 Tax=Mya arenaria TaxID=6604 RepID=UPI0022E05F8A|nr:achaete-scute homolog 4-like [Mya arenaria]
MNFFGHSHIPSEERNSDPFSPCCLIPLPVQDGDSLNDYPCFRRRNERERDRVRNVNEGYLKLKEHLPLENKERRLSKVETLRLAIDYIKCLQQVLSDQRDKQEGFKDS